MKRNKNENMNLWYELDILIEKVHFGFKKCA